MTRFAIAAFGLAPLAAACSVPSPDVAGDRVRGQGMIVLGVDTGPRSSPGPIQGAVKCGDDKLPPLPPCLPGDLALAEAVLSCGPVEATIDRGSSHRLFVYFPARMRDRFPAMPADVEIVKCVQSRIGFAFSAGEAADPDDAHDADPAPFAVLHSP